MEIRSRYSLAHSKLSDTIDEESANDSDSSNKFNYKNLRVFICTWNVNTQAPNFKINDLIKFNLTNKPDICSFGFQEINSKPLQRIYDYFYNDPWTNELDEILHEMEYIRIQSTRLVGILLNIYVKKPLVSYLKCCSEDWIRLGFWGFWGNKGANICTFKLGGVNICFVNSHLSAHQHQDKTRLLEHAKIMYHSFRLEKVFESVNDQNYLFFFGDLNFRIENLDIFEAKELIEKKDFKTLKENDQLQKCIYKEKCFSIFREDEITFAPTYKFILNTDNYDLNKKDRIPSWCDRILYKNAKGDFLNCKSLEYNSITTLKQSDHRPVYASFEIRTLNWETTRPNVGFLDIVANSDQNLEITYQISYSTTTHMRDWIGVYDPNLKSFQDYKTYAWAARIFELEEETRGKIKELSSSDSNKNFIARKITLEQHFVKSGYYILGYFSYVSNCLIGLSNVFQIQLS